MSRASHLLFLTVAVALSLQPVVTSAAPTRKKPAPVWHGYGFLPGYRQPLSNSLPLYKQENGTVRYAQANRRPWYIDPTPDYVGWDDEWHYVGRPGFYGSRYNGGSFGPCWTQTPIGPVWNCGK